MSTSTSTRKVPSNTDSYSDSPFSNQRWILPKRITFLFNKIQKNFLFNLFADGERTGKKHSPEEVRIAMRQKLSTSQYRSIKQIRSLFSRWSSKLKSTTSWEIKLLQVSKKSLLLPSFISFF